MPEPGARPAALDATLSPFLDHLRARFGARLDAVLLYGSYVRGKRDTVLDFHVLLDRYDGMPAWQRFANRVLPPNVYYVQLDATAAKYATITTEQFARAIEHGFDCYFWARFAQPSVVLAARDERVRARLAALATRAAERMIAATVPLLPTRFTSAELWRTAFAATYATELRSERPEVAAQLQTAYGAELDARTAAAAPGVGLIASADGTWRAHAPPRDARAQWSWRARRVVGKSLAVLRLLKAALTFDDALGYVTWKVARHSGVTVDVSARARRYPLLFGWGVLWRLYRRGGFR